MVLQIAGWTCSPPPPPTPGLMHLHNSPVSIGKLPAKHVARQAGLWCLQGRWHAAHVAGRASHDTMFGLTSAVAPLVSQGGGHVAQVAGWARRWRPDLLRPRQAGGRADEGCSRPPGQAPHAGQAGPHPKLCCLPPGEQYTAQPLGETLDDGQALEHPRLDSQVSAVVAWVFQAGAVDAQHCTAWQLVGQCKQIMISATWQATDAAQAGPHPRLCSLPTGGAVLD